MRIFPMCVTNVISLVTLRISAPVAAAPEGPEICNCPLPIFPSSSGSITGQPSSGSLKPKVHPPELEAGKIGPWIHVSRCRHRPGNRRLISDKAPPPSPRQSSEQDPLARQSKLQPGSSSPGKRVGTPDGKIKEGASPQPHSVSFSINTKFPPGFDPRRGRPKKIKPPASSHSLMSTEPIHGDKKRRMREAEKPLVFRQQLNSTDPPPSLPFLMKFLRHIRLSLSQILCSRMVILLPNLPNFGSMPVLELSGDSSEGFEGSY